MMVGVSAFGQLQLAEDDRTGLFESGDDGRILIGAVVAINLHTRRGRCIPGPAQVLDGDRHPVKRPLTLLAAISFSAARACSSADDAMTCA